MFRGFKKSNCLARERNFLIIYKLKKRKILRTSRAKTQFLKIRVVVSFARTLPSKTTLKAMSPIFYFSKKRRFVEDVSSESVIFKPT